MRAFGENQVNRRLAIVAFAMMLLVTGCREKQVVPSDADLKQFCQLALDVDQLQKYYHPEVEGRVPVVILENQYCGRRTPSLKKFGKPVLVLSKKEIEKRNIEAYITVERADFRKSTAKLWIEYPVEGLIVIIEYQKVGSGWIVSNHWAAER